MNSNRDLCRGVCLDMLKNLNNLLRTVEKKSYRWGPSLDSFERNWFFLFTELDNCSGEEYYSKGKTKFIRYHLDRLFFVHEHLIRLFKYPLMDRYIGWENEVRFFLKAMNRHLLKIFTMEVENI